MMIVKKIQEKNNIILENKELNLTKQKKRLYELKQSIL